MEGATGIDGHGWLAAPRALVPRRRSTLAAAAIRPGPGDGLRLEALVERLHRELGDGLVRVGVVRAAEGAGLEASLAPGLDPVSVVLRLALDEGTPALRCALVVGDDPEAGRRLLGEARAARDRLAIRTGEASADALLGALAPLLGDLIADLTARQRTLVRLVVADGLRQAEVAERMGIARATVSVMAARSHLRSIERLVELLRALLG